MALNRTRLSLLEVLRVVYAVTSIFLLWASLKFVTGSSHPILVVSSKSMEPTFYRGDVIILSNRQHIVNVGDIPVIWFAERPQPMVHRAIKVIGQPAEGGNNDGETRQLILTKGDNNEVDDTALYPDGRAFVHREEVIGLVKCYVPYLGQVSLWAKDRPSTFYTFVVGMVAIRRLLL